MIKIGITGGIGAGKSYICNLLKQRGIPVYNCDEEAKRLIRETNSNFFEISDMLMFSNSHYFSTTFKKYTGMTPSQYKNSCKTN